MKFKKSLIFPVFLIAVSLALVHGCSKKPLNEDSAMDIVANLAEVKKFSKLLESQKPPVKPAFTVEDGSPDVGRQYYMVTVSENHPTHMVTWERFFVNREDNSILVYDVVEDGYIPLETWRKKNK